MERSSGGPENVTLDFKTKFCNYVACRCPWLKKIFQLYAFVLPPVLFIFNKCLDLKSIYGSWVKNEATCAFLTLGVMVLSVVVGTIYFKNLLTIPRDNLNNDQLNDNERASPTPTPSNASGDESTPGNNEQLNDNEGTSSIFRQFKDSVPIVWYVKMLGKAWNSRMPNETNYVSDQVLIQIIENYLENAPQLIISIYVLVKTWDETSKTYEVIWRGFSILFLCISTVSYRQAIRIEQNILPLSLPWIILFVALNFAQIGARITLLALFAWKFLELFIALISAHFLIMLGTLLCVVKTRQQICPSGKGMMCHRAIFALIYIYTYVSISEERKYTVIIVFYVTTLIENAVITYYIASYFFKILFTIWFCGAFVYCWILINNYIEENSHKRQR